MSLRTRYDSHHPMNVMEMYLGLINNLQTIPSHELELLQQMALLALDGFVQQHGKKAVLGGADKMEERILQIDKGRTD